MRRFSRERFLFWGLLLEGGLAVLAWGIAALLSRDLFGLLRPSVKEVILGALCAFPLFWGLLHVMASPRVPFLRIRLFLEQEIRPLLAGYPWMGLLLLSLAAGLGEELLFRGLFQSLLSEWLGGLAGLFGASILFGLFHAVAPGYAVLATLVGIYFGILWEYFSSLTVPILAHAVHDFLALLYLVRKKAPQAEAPPS